ncbi:MAG: Spy/CpxP family protein refolding chaperone [Stellaceae bacterium]
MTRFRISLAAALLASTAALGMTPAMAQTAPAAPAPAQTAPAQTAPAQTAPAQTGARHHMKMMPGQLVEGRIAFLKAELRITPAQEAQWDQMAAAMRQNANAFDQAIADAKQHTGAMNAVDRLTMRGEFAKLHADNNARLLAALKPLYTALSPEQQQTANQLIGAQQGWHQGGWHHRA